MRKFASFLTTLILATFLLIPRFSTSYALQDVPLSNFKIVSFQGDWQGDTLYIIGEITNIGNVAAGVEVQVIVRDSSGTLIDCESF